MLLMIGHYASFTEKGLFPAKPAVAACTAPANGARVGEGR